MQIINYESNFYPNSLKNINSPPNKLYVEGNINLLNTTCFSIIGSRACSKYGMEMTKLFAKELSMQNLTIVSGMALGIDSIAHTATLDVNKNTIAILGSGFNKIFPKENVELYNRIIKNNGLIISEYPPEVTACSNNFLERNRIVSGISIGILVIEAAHRSGTSVTASLAKKQGKKVFCIPHNIGDKHGVGINRLIRNGAQVVSSPKDIVCSFDFLHYIERNNNKNITFEKPEVPEEYKEIYNILVGPPLNINQICEKINKKTQFINNAIFMLELNGNIIKTKEGYQANVF